MGYGHVEEITHLEEIPVPGKPLGRHVRHDSRSKQFRVARKAGPLRTVIHQRMIPVFDQGSLGSCTGNAAVGALGTKPLFDALPSGHPALDEAFAVTVYSAATRIDPYPGAWEPDDTGSDGLSVAKVLKQLGLIPGYVHALSLDDVLHALQDGPVITGVPWYEGMDNPDGRGLVRVTGRVRGGHEFLLLGVDMENRELIACNSWGDGYGLGGLFRIGFDDYARLLREEGDATVLLPLTAPAPAPTPVPGPVDADAEFAAVLRPWAFSRWCFYKSIKAAGRKWLAAKGL